MKKQRTKKYASVTTDGIAILDRMFFQGHPERYRALETARLNASIAQEIYDLRIQAGLTQKQLGKMVGTSHSVISRLEDADYEGHSLPMLQRISSALHYQVVIRLVPLPKIRRERVKVK